MLNIFRVILNTIFPPHKCLQVIKSETTESFSRHLYVHNYQNTVVLCDYTDDVVKAAITANKFYNSELAAKLLGSLVASWYQNQPKKETLFVPIPLSKSREQKRGYNQVTKILKAAAEPLNIGQLLFRHKHTPPQTTLNRQERLQNVVGAFSFNTSLDVGRYERIVIVDDVVTTGATLKAAKQELQSHLPKECELISLALAH